MNTTPVLDLISFHPYLKTKEDVGKTVTMLDSLSDKLFRQDTLNPSETFASELPYSLSTIIEKLISEQNIDMQDKKNLQAFINQLKKDLSSLPILHIILAIEPNQKLIDQIHSWLYETIKKLIILDITVDETIIAGAAISFDGRANDYSLRNQMEQTV